MALRGRTVGALAAMCVLFALSLATVGSAGAGAMVKGAGNCAKATEPATQVSIGDLRKAIQCLINVERADRGRSELGRDRRLAKAAGKHVKVMVQADCLDHVCGGEAPVETRIRNTGYFSGARHYDFAEDVGCEKTAAQMVKNWMSSSLHRRNLLNRRFEDFGIGASHGRVPSRCDAGYVTFVVVFGHRSG